MRIALSRHGIARGSAQADHGSGEFAEPQRADLEITAVTSHGWRVCDARRPMDDPFRLLGFLEQRPDGFEVMQLGEGFEWHRADSMEAALAFVLSTAVAMARARQGGDLAWIR